MLAEASSFDFEWVHISCSRSVLSLHYSKLVIYTLLRLTWSSVFHRGNRCERQVGDFPKTVSACGSRNNVWNFSTLNIQTQTARTASPSSLPVCQIPRFSDCRRKHTAVAGANVSAVRLLLASTNERLQEIFAQNWLSAFKKMIWKGHEKESRIQTCLSQQSYRGQKQS